MIIVRTITGVADQTARRAAAEEIARNEFGCSIVRNTSGAPSLENGKAHISISHTKQVVAVAFDNKQVGLDIEFVDRKVDHLASRFATAQEIAICGEFFAENPVLMVWCAKEAIYKTLHRDGVDFLRDMTITSASASANRLFAIGDQKEVELSWELRDNLLIVCTI